MPISKIFIMEIFVAREMMDFELFPTDIALDELLVDPLDMNSSHMQTDSISTLESENIKIWKLICFGLVFMIFHLSLNCMRETIRAFTDRRTNRTRKRYSCVPIRNELHMLVCPLLRDHIVRIQIRYAISGCDSYTLFYSLTECRICHSCKMGKNLYVIN